LAESHAGTTAVIHKTEVLAYPCTFPTLCAIIPDEDPTSILLGSSPTLYRGIPGVASVADNILVMLLGSAEENLVLFVLPEDAFARLTTANVVSITIDSNAHHTAYTNLGSWGPPHSYHPQRSW